jgi:protein pelota
MQALLRTVDFAVVKCVVLASPGFYRDALLAYMMAEAVRLELRPLLENRSKFVLAYAASGHKYALRGAAPAHAYAPVYAHPELIVRRRRAGRD